MSTIAIIPNRGRDYKSEAEVHTARVRYLALRKVVLIPLAEAQPGALRRASDVSF